MACIRDTFGTAFPFWLEDPLPFVVGIRPDILCFPLFSDYFPVSNQYGHNHRRITITGAFLSKIHEPYKIDSVLKLFGLRESLHGDFLLELHYTLHSLHNLSSNKLYHNQLPHFENKL